MNKKLIVNSENIDLYENVLVPITIQANDPIEIDTFQSSYSISFKIPNTLNNRRAFRFSNDISIVSGFPYVFSSCSYFQNGIELFPFALLYLNSYNSEFLGEDYFEVQIVNGVKGFFERWGEDKLNTIPDNVISKVYATLNRIKNYQKSNDTFFTRADRSMESLYLKSLIDYIATENGFTYSFPYGTPNLPNYNRLLLPYCGENIPIANEESKRDSGLIKFDNISAGSSQIIAGGGGIVGFQFNLNQQAEYNTVNNTFQGGTLGVDGVWAGSGYVRALITIVYNSLSGAIRPLLTFKIRKDNPTPVYYDIGGSFLSRTVRLAGTSGGNVIQTGIEIYIQTTTLDAGTNPVLIPVLDGQGVAGAYIINIIGLEFNVQKIDNDILQYGLQSRHFDISKKELFKNFCYIYGMMLQQDNYTKEIKIIPFDIVNDFTRALDWSAKLDVSKNIQYTYTLNNFAQKNIINPKANYTNSELSVFDANYQGYLTCFNELLELQKTILQLLFSFSLEDFPSSNVISNVYVPQFNIDVVVNDYRFNELARLSTFSQSKAEQFIVNYTQNNSEDSGQSVLKYESNTVLYTVNKRTTLEHLSPRAIVQNHYNTYNSFLDRTRKVECYLVLSASDIATVDFSRAIYLEAFKAHFCLSSIEQWTDGKDSVKCVLYALNQEAIYNVGNGLRFIENEGHYAIKRDIIQYNKNLISIILRITTVRNIPSKHVLYYVGEADANSVQVFIEELAGNYVLTFEESEAGNQNIFQYTLPFNPIGIDLHVAWRREGVSVAKNKIYINGVSVSYFVNLNTLVNQIHTFNSGLVTNEILGNDLTNKHLDAIIYDCKLFRNSNAITDFEIAELYRYKGSYLPENMNNTLLYDYRCNELQGEFLYNCNHVTGESNFRIFSYSIHEKIIGASNCHVDKNGNAILIVQ